MARSLKKGYYVAHHLAKKVEKLNQDNKKEPIKTWSRASVIEPSMLEHTILIHNGQKHVPLYVTENTIGHRLGEFAPTRRFTGHGGKKKK